MQFNCGLKRSMKQSSKVIWHEWFAWYPVKVARFDCRWLEHVQRIGTPVPTSFGSFLLWDWKYKALTGSTQ